MKTTAKPAVPPGRRRRATSPQHRCIVLRNGLATRLEAVTVRCPGFAFTGRVCFPLPLPPGDPYVFRSTGRAHAAVERTQRLCRLLRESIHLDYILAHYPALNPFALPATWTVERAKKKRA